ncbi:hypothetical protein [Tenacibaculum xiamenense]|uniref:hypothetical protein n=1 Tax=Tenacibaculum xiamenense TaxID=1261553 RepID=UPI003895CBE4
MKISLEKGFMSKSQIDLTNTFTNDLKEVGIDKAINNYENKVLKMKLSNDEFSKHNAFINGIKSVNYQNPDLFKGNFELQSRSAWRCALAVVAMTAAIASVGSCISIVACGVAYLLVVNAGYGIADNC